MSELPHDPIDELIQRAHNNAHGAPPSFKGRLRARMAAETTVRRQTRMLYVKLGVAAAAALIIALVIGMNVDLFIPNRVSPPPPQAKDDTPQPANRPVQPAPREKQQPELKPEPQPEPALEPKPEPKPDETIEKPEPEPSQLEDVAEKPDPEPTQPEDAIEKPEPEQPKDTVEKPEPRQPEGSEVKPETRTEVATLLSRDTKLEVRYGEQEWREARAGETFYSGVQFKSGRSPVDIRLMEGAYARFDGELSLSRAGDLYSFNLSDDTLYVDNLALGAPVQAVANGITAEMSDGAGLFYAVRGGHEAACLAGEIVLAGELVEPLTTRKATERDVGDPKNWKGDRFLRGLPDRPILREDFNTPPPGGMYRDGERLEDGVAVMETAPHYIAFRHNPTLEVLPGMVLRARLRTTNVSRLELELFTQNEIDLLKKNPQIMFKHIWNPEKNGEWFELELRVEQIPDNTDPEHFPKHGDLLRNFKLHFVGDKLEIDWVEFVRVQE